MAKQNAYAQLATEDKTLIELKEMLNMDKMPQIIECFDISNIGAAHMVGACIQFKDKKPNKSAYAHYNIKEVSDQDDFRALYEVIQRRYSKFPLPDLLLIDGGQIQLKFVLQALTDINLLPPSTIGLAKKEETIIFANGQEKKLNRKTEAAKLLMQIRDATHHHVINFYRQKHKKAYKASELDSIQGIGEATKFKLLKEFKTIENIKNAPEEEIGRVIGKKKGQELKEQLKMRSV